VQQLLNSNQRFTALVSFNDVAAMGAMRALQDAGLRVPTDVSVIGFDDIRAAAFISPSLTTIRQPLREMGWMASEYLLARLQGVEKFREEIVIYPALTVRESTAAVSHAAYEADPHRKARKASKAKDAAPRNRTAALAQD
jgi:LacI family transcriptional regulator